MAFFILGFRFAPVLLVVIPLFSVFQTIGLYDTYVGMIWVYQVVTLPMIVWLSRSYIEDIPKDIEEAAAMDGAKPVPAAFSFSQVADISGGVGPRCRVCQVCPYGRTVGWPRKAASVLGMIPSNGLFGPQTRAPSSSERPAGLPICFATNNSTHTPADVASKLAGLGLVIAPKDVATSAITAAELIRATYPEFGRIFVIGAPSLMKAMTNAGLAVTGRQTEALVMGSIEKLGMRSRGLRSTRS
ncbi:hypothetical protein [Bradyrhizobium sp. 23]|uniref:hypothetical protein n=1 Tax=Bradyrhizobium sp. 23 TaxID=2782667 RepID=UPI001FFAAC9E